MARERFSAVYLLSGPKRQALSRAQDICYEQTVELPDDLIPCEFIKKNVLGNIESFKKSGSAFKAEISYPVEAAASELSQLINVIFGNISLKTGIRLEYLDLSDRFLKAFSGPGFGVRGLRKKLGIFKRPLLCTALKPMGLSSRDLAKLAYQFALGGMDIIKDDHGLTNQCWAPFKERVELCTSAIREANKKTGFTSVYAANITASLVEIKKRALCAKRAGAGVLMMAPGITGFDVMRDVAGDKKIGLPVISHPAFAGSFMASQNSGLSHYCFFGQLNRLAGADAAIFPNYGGRFSFSPKECRSIVRGCCDRMGHIRTIFPCPGGGMSLKRVRQMCDFYGPDVIFLIGGGLMRGNVVSNCLTLRSLVFADRA
ncbi:MAG: RuBisCO large subunit C-terminal-like domain-containing protein [Candidatus Omnitrophota bacterium]